MPSKTLRQSVQHPKPTKRFLAAKRRLAEAALRIERAKFPATSISSNWIEIRSDCLDYFCPSKWESLMADAEAMMASALDEYWDARRSAINQARKDAIAQRWSDAAP